MSMERKRIVAIDYGEKRVGIAISDPLRIFAIPLSTLERNKNFWTSFLAILSKYEIERIILGYPLKENNEKSSSTLLVEKFYDELCKRIKTPVEFVDERYSSKLAKKNIINSVTSKKKRREKGLIDRNAAAIILTDYLNEIKDI
jgi:putative Holliday junction resolvase